MPIPNPSQAMRLVDENGNLTPNGWMWFLSVLDYIRELEARIAVLEA